MTRPPSLAAAFLLSLASVSCQGPHEKALSPRTSESRPAGQPIRVVLKDFAPTKDATVNTAIGSPSRGGLLSMPGVFADLAGKDSRADARPAASASKQEKSNWCWATCAQMIYSFNGDAVPQSEIVKRIKGDGTVNDPATYHEVLFALNPDLQGARGWADELLEALEKQRESDVTVNLEAVYKAFIPRLFNSSDWIVDEVRSGQPLVLGMAAPPGQTDAVGHCYTAYGVDYRVREFEFMDHLGKFFQDFVNAFFNSEHGVVFTKDYELVQVHTVNPWDGAVKIFSAEEFHRDVEFVISKPIARAILENELKLLDVKPKGQVPENALFQTPDQLFRFQAPQAPNAPTGP